jgi:beta-N-acetylhexosaminidase
MPATLSPIMVNGVLRGQLGYQGVVMTDSLYMAAISEHYNLPEAAVLSVEAGDDLLEGAYDSYTMSAMLAALQAAISSGSITVDRINQSVVRILELKARFGLIPLLPVPGVSTYGAFSGAGDSLRGVQALPAATAEFAGDLPRRQTA